MLDQLRVLCFDLDDTLWDVGRVIDGADAAVEAFLQQHYPRIAERHDRSQLRAGRLALAEQQPQLAHDLTWLRTESMRQVAVALGYPDRAGEEAFEVFIAARNKVEFYPDVLPALEHLGQRFRLASLSNGNADLARVGIDQHFAVSFSARQLGVAKPDPRSFGAVVTALGVSPSQVAYVGDDPDIDVVGARAAGLRTVWIHRGRRDWPAALAAPDLAVADLAALTEWASAVSPGTVGRSPRE